MFAKDDVSVQSNKTKMTTLVKAEDTVTDKETLYRMKDSPYPDYTPTQVLGRKYLIQSNVLHSGDTFGFWPEKDLVSQTAISTYLKLFGLYRSDIEVDIVLTTNQMQYGLVALGYLPYYASAVGYTSDVALSQSNMLLLDVAEQSSAKIKLPYLNPALWVETNNPELSKMWRLFYKVLCLDALTIATTSSVQIDVFASFVNIQTAGPQSAVFQSGELPLFDRNYRVAQGSPWTRTSAVVQGLAGAAASSTLYGVGSSVYNKFAGLLPEPVQELAEEAMSIEKHTENVKLDMTAGLSLPVVQETVTSRLLGDGIPHRFEVPDLDNIFAITQICQVPVINNTTAFTGTAMYQDIVCTPFPANSHALYVSKMFKHFKGGSKILLRFSCSPLISARFRVTLFPMGVASDSLDTIGDLPTWVISVKGSMEWGVGIPYLQTTPWCDIQGDFIKPVVRIRLLDELPQPYDKQVAIYITSFLSAAEDIVLSGLESFRPGIAFQSSLRDSMSAIRLMGGTQLHNYQGGIGDIRQILGRFSSREPVLTDEAPLPRLIVLEDTLYYYDNFDYICNMYGFWSGNTHVKVLFSKGSAGGVLEYAIKNSKTAFLPVGDDGKCGNSMVATHQAVWPLLEFEFPYQSVNAFQSLHFPTYTTEPVVDGTAEVSRYWIAAAPSLTLGYLFPVPEFAVFQSYNTQRTYTSRFSVGAAATGVAYPITVPVNTDSFSEFELHATIARTSGTTDDLHYFSCSLNADTDSIVDPVYTDPSDLVSLLCLWKSDDDKAIFSYKNKNCFIGTTGPTLFIKDRIFGASSFGSTYLVCLTLKLQGYSSLIRAAISNSWDDPVKSAVSNSMEFPFLDINVVNVEQPVLVTVDHDIPVTVENAPLMVSFDSDLPVYVMNDPLIVSMDPLVPFTIQGQVQGMPNPTYPVITGLY